MVKILSSGEIAFGVNTMKICIQTKSAKLNKFSTEMNFQQSAHTAKKNVYMYVFPLKKKKMRHGF